MPLIDPYATLAMRKELAVEFFGLVARCEYTMKESHLYERDEGGRAAPAWSKLANDATNWLQVEAGSALDQALDTLTQVPPRVQLFGNGGWVASPLPGAGRVAQAVNAAVRVRNNLFHGGKHTPEAAAGRDAELVHAALTLLTAVVEQAPQAFRAVYEHV